ncbi:MAG: phosphate acyltransferase [Bacteroidota bacterium]
MPQTSAKLFPESNLTGRANMLVCPCQSSASIAYNMFKVLGDCVPIGPILLGADKPVHIMTNATGTRGTLNLTALATAEVNVKDSKEELPLV